MSSLTICLIIFVLTIIGYCSGKISIATVSLTSLMALSITGCLDQASALAYFSNNNVIMIAGMCVVAAGFNRTKFCMLLAGKISAVSKGSLTRMMFGYVLLGIILSQFIQSPVAVFGIVAPMLIASAESMGISPSKVVFPLCVSVIITCCTLPLGAGATVAAELNGYLESYGYTDFMVNLADPMKARLPLLICCLLYCVFAAPKLAPDQKIVASNGEISKTKGKEPLTNFQDYAGLAIFFADALALMFSSSIHLENWQITVIGALLMVLCGVLKPREAVNAVPLSMLLLIVGALGMSGALAATGAGDLIGGYIGQVVAAVNGNSYIVGFIFFLIPFALTQVMQNRATMMIFHPIAIATCAATGANPVGLMILIQAGCLSAFMTPMATAAVPYIMDYGGYDQASMFKQSGFLALMCAVVSVLWTMTIFPL